MRQLSATLRCVAGGRVIAMCIPWFTPCFMSCFMSCFMPWFTPCFIPCFMSCFVSCFMSCFDGTQPGQGDVCSLVGEASRSYRLVVDKGTLDAIISSASVSSGSPAMNEVRGMDDMCMPVPCWHHSIDAAATVQHAFRDLFRGQYGPVPVAILTLPLLPACLLCACAFAA